MRAIEALAIAARKLATLWEEMESQHGQQMADTINQTSSEHWPFQPGDDMADTSKRVDQWHAAVIAAMPKTEVSQIFNR